MEIKRIFLIIFIPFFLNGCAQSVTSLMGPAITTASTGNIYQAGLSYGFNSAVEIKTGKTPMKHVVHILEIEKEKIENKNKLEPIETTDKLFVLIKNNIEKTRVYLNLDN